MEKKYKIGIVGIGMVGSPLKKYFEMQGWKRGKDLFCYDSDPKKGYFDDVKKAQIIFICVPTPRNADGSCNINIVESVVKEYADKNQVLVIKSTVEPGTTERLAKKYKCPILFNPEFLTESRAWEDMINPDRQIVGHAANSKIHSMVILRLLPTAFFSAPGALDAYNFTRVNSTEAELGKYACNVFGAIKVTFGNILADFCNAASSVLEKEGLKTEVNYENVKNLISHDARIGGAWLNINHGNYRGFGGYCFPKDSDAFIKFGEKLEKKLGKNDINKKLIAKGLVFLKALREYNIELLKSQGLTIEKVSYHDNELIDCLKNKNNKPR